MIGLFAFLACRRWVSSCCFFFTFVIVMSLLLQFLLPCLLWILFYHAFLWSWPIHAVVYFYICLCCLWLLLFLLTLLPNLLNNAFWFVRSHGFRLTCFGWFHSSATVTTSLYHGGDVSSDDTALQFQKPHQPNSMLKCRSEYIGSPNKHDNL